MIDTEEKALINFLCSLDGKLDQVLGTLDEIRDILEQRPAPPFPNVWEAFLKQLASHTEAIKDLTISEFWYGVLVKLYEMPPPEDPIKRYGFLISANVAPGATFTFDLDLTGAGQCCICPKFVACCDLGPVYGRLTILVNQSPINIPIIRKHPEWQDRYVAMNLPLPTDIPHSLAKGWDHVVFPKVRVRIQFVNEHPTQIGAFVFYSDYFCVTQEHGLWLIEHIYTPLVERLRKLIVPL